MTTALLLKFLKDHWKGLAIAAGISLLLLVIFFQRQCGTSPLEKKLEETNNQVIEQKATEQVVEEKAAEKEIESKRLDTVAKEKVKKAREAQNADTRGTSYDDANSARCAAYPDDSECK